MSDMMIILLLSLVVIYQDFRTTRTNFGAVYNGIGSIPAVLRGESLAPMQYRVLVPWICKPFGEGEKSIAYLMPFMYLRWLSIVFAVSMANLFYLGDPLCMVMLSIFLVVAALYDYTDVYLEIGFFALAFWLLSVGLVWWIVPVVLVASFNRETSVFIPLAVILNGDVWAGGVALLAFAVGYMVPRFVYGKVGRYCSFNMVNENLREIVRDYSSRPAVYVEYTWFAILCGGMIYGYLTGPLTAVALTMGVLFIALLVPSKWREIRVFAPCVLTLIPMVVR